MWIGVTTEIQKIKDEEIRKGNFLKIVSHELETPITSIKGYVQLLLNKPKDEQLAMLAPSPVKSSLIRIDVQIARLTKLISQILDVSRIEESKLILNKEWFSLRELVMETVQDILHTNSKLIINVYPEFTGYMYGDKDRIGQAPINFINNAIKYSPNSRTVEVRIEGAKKDQASVSVKDFGIGVALKDQEKIFDRFYRVEGKTENVFVGFGFGLFIAKEIIQMHNGSISVQSEPGKSCRFTILLPCISDY